MRIGIKISKGRIIVLTAAAIAAAGAFYLWRDLNLSSQKNIPIPDIVVENIELDRVIDGKNWHIKSPRVEHKDGIVYGDSMDVVITGPADRVTHITARKGDFSRSTSDLNLQEANGVMNEKGKTYKMQSGVVNYVASPDVWNFGDGVTLSIDKMVITGKKGSYVPKTGDCRVLEGGKITWDN